MKNFYHRNRRKIETAIVQILVLLISLAINLIEFKSQS